MITLTTDQVRKLYNLIAWLEQDRPGHNITIENELFDMADDWLSRSKSHDEKISQEMKVSTEEDRAGETSTILGDLVRDGLMAMHDKTVLSLKKMAGEK